MTDHAKREILIQRYLLGQVSAEEREELENHYFGDDDLFEEMVAAENDMIDAYVSGKLGAGERKQFENYFLSTPERQERVEFAESLMQHGSPRGATEAKRGWLDLRGFSGMRLALATVLLIVVAGASWLAIVNRKLIHQLEAARDAQADAQRQAQELSRQVVDLQKQAGQNPEIAELPAPGSAILSVTLASDLVRDVHRQQSTLHLSPDISEVRFLLNAGHDNSSAYTAVLEAVEGSRIWRTSGLAGRLTRGGGKVVIVQVPPNVLKRDDYVLRLFASTSAGRPTEVGTYSFRIIKQ